MRVLLDTHAFLWFLAGDDRLPERVRELVVDPRNEVLLSMASVWEMAIKASMGKLVLTRPFDAMIREQLSRQRIGLFGVELAHVLGGSPSVSPLGSVRPPHRGPGPRGRDSGRRGESLPECCWGPGSLVSRSVLEAGFWSH